MIAAAITNSEITLKNVVADHLLSLISKLEEMGIKIIDNNNEIKVVPSERLKPISVKTMPHPGFPTDMQSKMMTSLSSDRGTNTLTASILMKCIMSYNKNDSI